MSSQTRLWRAKQASYRGSHRLVLKNNWFHCFVVLLLFSMLQPTKSFNLLWFKILQITQYFDRKYSILISIPITGCDRSASVFFMSFSLTLSRGHICVFFCMSCKQKVVFFLMVHLFHWHKPHASSKVNPSHIFILHCANSSLTFCKICVEINQSCVTISHQ